MYRAPSNRKFKQKAEAKLNLVPILDSVFILIFFLLMSANFLKIFEISSDVPIVSNKEPPKNDRALALTLKITNNGMTLYSGVPSRQRASFGRKSDGAFETEKLHTHLVNLKKKYKDERGMILEPQINIKYKELVKIMDAIRMLKNTDDQIFKKDKDGVDKKVNELFDKIVFSNLFS